MFYYAIAALWFTGALIFGALALRTERFPYLAVATLYAFVGVLYLTIPA